MLQRECGASFRTVAGSHVAAVNFGNAADDGQPQAGAAALGGEKRFEHAAANFVGQARSAVGNFQFESARADDTR